MATISNEELLESVKASNLITGDYLDAMLLQKIAEVKHYLISAGVSEEIANSDVAIGTIAIGVNDLLSPQGTGGGQALSPYFMQRVFQLR